MILNKDDPIIGLLKENINMIFQESILNEKEIDLILEEVNNGF
jgi:hypothetical protein